MKNIFMVVILMVLVVSFAQTQFKIEVTEEPTKDAGAEITITGTTLDEVWDSITRALMLLKFNISESEKDSGLIIAHKRVGALLKAANTGGEKIQKNDMPNWNLSIKEGNTDDEIIIFCMYSGGEGTIRTAGKKPFKKLVEKIQSVMEK